MLKLQLKDRQTSPVWVTEKLYSIGSGAENHLVLQHESVAPVHAHLVTSAHKVYLKDNHSHGGCYINGQRVTQKDVLPGDVIRLGDVELELLAPTESDDAAPADGWRLVAEGGWLTGKSYPIPQGRPVTIGRADNNDIVIPGAHLSRRHAQLQLEGEQVRVQDLHSVSGTYLNDALIDRALAPSILARSGDRLRLDVYSFRIVGPEQAALPPVEAQPPERIKPAPQAPKRWKTRPTSPGNRHEPATRQRPEMWLWAVLIIAAILLIGGLYWV